MVKENALAIRRTEVTEVMCVLDLDPDAEMTRLHVAVGSGDTDARRFSAVHSDIKEAEHVTPGLSSSEGRELVTSSRAPHSGCASQNSVHSSMVVAASSRGVRAMALFVEEPATGKERSTRDLGKYAVHVLWEQQYPKMKAA